MLAVRTASVDEREGVEVVDDDEAAAEAAAAVARDVGAERGSMESIFGYFTHTVF